MQLSIALKTKIGNVDESERSNRNIFWPIVSTLWICLAVQSRKSGVGWAGRYTIEPLLSGDAGPLPALARPQFDPGKVEMPTVPGDWHFAAVLHIHGRISPAKADMRKIKFHQNILNRECETAITRKLRTAGVFPQTKFRRKQKDTNIIAASGIGWTVGSTRLWSEGIFLGLRSQENPDRRSLKSE